MNSTATNGVKRDMPPHGGTNEVFKVSPNSEDGMVPIEKDNKPASRLGMLQKGLTKKMQAGSNKLFHKSGDSNIDASKRSQVDASRRNSMGESRRNSMGASRRNSMGASKGYSKNQVVWYKFKGKENRRAKILSIDMGPQGKPFYTIKLLESGREKQTDDAHLEELGPNDAPEGSSQARFKTDQVVFHKPSDGAPIYLAQITRVYQGDDQPLYDITLQGSNVTKSSIKESDLFDMHEAPGVGTNAPAQSPSNTSRKSTRRSRSPKRVIKKVLSSEGLKEMKRGIKKVGSMEGLEKMRNAVRGKSLSRDKSRDRSVKRATPSKTKSGMSSDGSADISKPSSARSLLSTEKRGSRIKKTRSMEGMREMMQAGKQPSNSSVEGIRRPARRPGVKKSRSMEGMKELTKPPGNQPPPFGSPAERRPRRPGVKKTKSMEGMRDMMQGSQSAHTPKIRRAPPSTRSMMSNQSGHKSVRSHRPPRRTPADREKLDRERGVQRSKSLEGMHPRHLRRPSKERLGPPAMPNRGGGLNRSWHKEPGDGPRPPVRTPSGALHGGNPALQNAGTYGQVPHRASANKGIPMRNGSTDSKRRKSPRSLSSLRRPVPPPPASTPPIRAVKKVEYDSDDSEESSISSVSWQEPKPRSFQMPPKKDAPKPTEITVDMDDASSVSSDDDSSWESFRGEGNKFKPGSMQRQWQQKMEANQEKRSSTGNATHATEIIGFDSVAGVEVRVQTVYSSDEESESSVELDFEPEPLFDWVH
eukprot:CAMPEP_0113648064 /NCGR_PEP_ID=MMETSP0017_2-20120614/25476_1 /TAXON_ID=2856 /ORGANISM="Cylindrotheca closterium" /LENGTH=755 /DNA_ID=CAMNT_0000560225 /DNA_START=1 /DNA_END=2268 /DNA_ORIENTATION=+ /assembly_acc=CAM_ASM_000147